MAFYFHKKSIMSSAGALATVLKTYEAYNEKIQYLENEEELHEKAITNVSSVLEHHENKCRSSYAPSKSGQNGVTVQRNKIKN
ncbi:hypothetical protein Aduo_002211 [Ancylostoma duodenale]